MKTTTIRKNLNTINNQSSDKKKKDENDTFNYEFDNLVDK